MENKYFEKSPQESYNICCETLVNCKDGFVHAKGILRKKESYAFNRNFDDAWEADEALRQYLFWKESANFWKRMLVVARRSKRKAWQELNNKENQNV